MKNSEDVRGEPDPTNLAGHCCPPPHHPLQGLDVIRSQKQTFLSTQGARTHTHTGLIIVSTYTVLTRWQALY